MSTLTEKELRATAYQDGARACQLPSVLTADQATKSIADLGRDGDAIRSDDGRPLLERACAAALTV